MAKADMEGDARVEASRVLRRIAAKGPVPGPRERLAIPTDTTPNRERTTGDPARPDPTNARQAARPGPRRPWAPLDRVYDEGADDLERNRRQITRHMDCVQPIDGIKEKVIEKNLHGQTGDVSFILANARSLAPKITSLIDMICERDLPFAAVTETWFRGGKQLQQELTDVEMAAGIKIICRNRKERGMLRGGGVGFAFRTAIANFKERKIKNIKDYEILCVVGNVAGSKNKMVIFTLYIPQKTKVAQLEEITELLGTEIAAVKATMSSPVVVWTSMVAI